MITELANVLNKGFQFLDCQVTYLIIKNDIEHSHNIKNN